MEMSPIAFIRTPYKEKFAVPRQPGIVDAIKGQIEFISPYNDRNILRGIEQFSHLWLIFQFHQTAEHGWKPLVRPPRMGGNEKLGVFATRSTFRPNAIGMSVVSRGEMRFDNGQLTLEVSGMDLVDGTPIVDIKPYLPYVDAIPDATAGFAQSTPAQKPVIWSETARKDCERMGVEKNGKARAIEAVLSQDPRPAYKAETEDEKVYGMRLWDMNIKWQYKDEVIQILSLEQTDN